MDSRSRPRRPEEVAAGLHACIGATQTGKTTEAIAVAQAIARARRAPLVAVDPANTRALAHLVPVRTVPELAHRIYGAGLSCRWSPGVELEEADKVFRLARDPGGLVLLVDECSLFATSKALLHLCRTWAHARTSVVLTGQDLRNDLGSKLRSCGLLLRVFRMPKGAGLDWLARNYGVDREKINSQPVGQHHLMKL
jgi:hypothetical protein